MGGKARTNLQERKAEPYDMRRLHPAKKQSAIMSIFDSLKPGQAFSVVLDFDPDSLKRQFEAFLAGDFTWVCLELGPREWLIEIGRREPPRPFEDAVLLPIERGGFRTLAPNRGERGELAELPHRERTVPCDRRYVVKEKGEVQVNAAVPFGLSDLVEILQEQ